MLLRQFKSEKNNEQFDDLFNDKIILDMLPEYIVAAYRQGHTDEIFHQIDYDKIKVYCKNQDAIAKIYHESLEQYQQEAFKQIKKDAILIKQFGIHQVEAEYYKDNPDIKNLVNKIQNSPFKSIYKHLLVERNNIQTDLAKLQKIADKIKYDEDRKEQTQKRKDQIALRLKNANVKQIYRPTIEDDYAKQQQLLSQLNQQYEKARQLSESYSQQKLEKYQQKNNQYLNKCYQIQQLMDSQNYEKELKTMKYFEQYNSPQKNDLTITYPRQFHNITKPIRFNDFMDKQAQRTLKVQDNLEQMEYNDYQYKQQILQKIYERNENFENQKISKPPDSKLAKRIEEAKVKREKLYSNLYDSKVKKIEEKNLVTARMLKSLKEIKQEEVNQRKKAYEEKTLRHNETLNLSQLREEQQTQRLLNSLIEEPEGDKEAENILNKINSILFNIKYSNMSQKQLKDYQKQVVELLKYAQQ